MDKLHLLEGITKLALLATVAHLGAFDQYWLAPIVGAFIGWTRSKGLPPMKRFWGSLLDSLGAAIIVFLLVFTVQAFKVWRQPWSEVAGISAPPPPSVPLQAPDLIKPTLSASLLNRPLSNAKLCAKTLKLCANMRQMRKNFDIQLDQLHKQYGDDHNSPQMWKIHQNIYVEEEQSYYKEFAARFLAEATEDRDELNKRLNDFPPRDPELANAFAGHFVGTGPDLNMANYLEWLAKGLPK